MTNQVYNHSVRTFLYREIAKQFGSFDRERFTVGTCAPRGTPAIDRDTFYDELHVKVSQKCLDEGLKPPKSGPAVANQVCWATGVQRNVGADQVYLRHANRQAAYDSGFFTMDDILFLERETDRRAARDLT